MATYIKDYRRAFARAVTSDPPEPSIRDGHMLQNFYRTKKEIVQAVLPPPLEVPGDPQVYVYHCYWAQPAFGEAYYESAQFVRAGYKGKEGWYLLAMYVENDVSLWIGRELFGLPKRIAGVTLVRDGNNIWGTTMRKDIKIMSAEMEIAEERPHDKHMETWTVKCSLNTNAELEYAKLISLPYRVVDKVSYVGHGSVSYEKSDSDPTMQLELVEPLTCWYMVHDMYRGPASQILEFEPDSFYPYLTARMIG